MRYFLVALCVFSLEAAAVSVSPNPLLPRGTNVDNPALGWQATTLTAEERPSGLTGQVGVINLGTNTDIFITASADYANSMHMYDYWVRYTLDSSSKFTYDYYPDSSTTPLSGELWLSFIKVNTNGYRIDFHADQIDGLYPPQSTLIGVFDEYRHMSSQQDVWQSFPISSLFFSAFTGDGDTSLNLSFLKLEWNGQRYELKTSMTGFDQVFYEWASEGAFGTVSLNIAPVPLPTSAGLLLSGLTGLVGARRFRKPVI